MASLPTPGIRMLLILGLWLIIDPNMAAASSTALPGLPQAAITTPPDFKVAFIADQDVTTGSAAVLQMIKDEGADMVLHQGDLGYAAGADAWDQQINDILGTDFPYFASVGNHDVLNVPEGSSWALYQQKLQDRLDRIEGDVCDGNLGVES